VCLSSKDTRHRCHAEYAKIQDIDLSWVDLSAGLFFFCNWNFPVWEGVFLKKNLSGTPPPSLTKDSIFFHWQPGRLVPIIGWWTTPALFTGQGMEVDRPNQKTSPALDVLKSCTMTQWHFYYCLPNHVNLNMPRCDEKTTSASCWLPLHTETFRNHLGVPCGDSQHVKGGCSWISRIHFDSSVVSTSLAKVRNKGWVLHFDWWWYMWQWNKTDCSFKINLNFSFNILEDM
jgi:hypothetical protein